MTDDAKRLLEQALDLPRYERAELAAKLVNSVNALADVESAWISTIEARARRALGGSNIHAEPVLPTSATKVSFDVDAEVDLECATTDYEKHPGQVSFLLEEVRVALKRVRRKPYGFGQITALPPTMRVRRVFLKEFPYALAFMQLGEEIKVLAMIHSLRPPSEQGEISISALVRVEDWLAEQGWRTLSVLATAGIFALTS